MIYYAKINGDTKKVTIDRQGDVYRITIGDEVFLVDHRNLEGVRSLSLLVNSRCYDASVANVEGAKLVSISGEKFEIGLTDELTFLSGLPTVSYSQTDEEVVKTPMPGVVVSVEVTPGQNIEAGSPVVIVEAMKMQNEISSVSGGTVKDVLVRPGDTVESNQKLVLIRRA